MKAHAILGMILVLSGCCESSCLSQSTNVFSAGHVIVPASYIYIVGISESKIEEWKIEESNVSLIEFAINSLFARPDKRMKGLLGDIPTREPFPLSDYYMQYAGVIKDGKKLIIGKGFHKLHSDPKSVLKSPEQTNGVITFNAVWGGGSRFFTVVYNATDKRLVELTYNAPL